MSCCLLIDGDRAAAASSTCRAAILPGRLHSEARRSRLQPPFSFGETRCLHPVARPELLDRGGEVVAHGAFGEVELGRYVLDGRPVRRGGEHLALAPGERGLALAQGCGGQGGVHHPLASHDPTDGRYEVRSRSVLEEESDGAALHRTPEITGSAEGG